MKVYAATDIGRVRPINEDSYYLPQPGERAVPGRPLQRPGPVPPPLPGCGLGQHQHLIIRFLSDPVCSG